MGPKSPLRTPSEVARRASAKKRGGPPRGKQSGFWYMPCDCERCGKRSWCAWLGRAWCCEACARDARRED